MNDRAIREIDAYQQLARLLEQADVLRKRFVAAGLPLPPPLSRLVGENLPGTAVGENSRRVRDFPKPDIATDEWIAIRRNDLVVQDLVLALLRSIDKPVRQKDICDKAIELGATGVSGSVYNIFPRLQDKLLKRNKDDTWELIDPERAPLLQDEYAWGPPKIFHEYSIAAYRREQILLALKRMPSGLTAMQLVDSLSDCRVPVDKDKIKGDMLSLQKNHLVRKGFQRKWALNDEGGDG